MQEVVKEVKLQDLKTKSPTELSSFADEVGVGGHRGDAVGVGEQPVDLVAHRRGVVAPNRRTLFEQMIGRGRAGRPLDGGHAVRA